MRLLVTGAGATCWAGCSRPAVSSQRRPSAKPAEPAKPAEAAKPAAPAAAATTAPALPPRPSRGREAGRRCRPSGGQISVHWTKPVTLNPLYSTASLEQGVERLMFGALVRVNDKLEAILDLAEKIDVSPDAKTYTFTLKKGITFTDGKPLTSQDVKFTYERAVDKRAGSYWRGRLLDIQGATEYGDQQAPTISGWRHPTTTPSR